MKKIVELIEQYRIKIDDISDLGYESYVYIDYDNVMSDIKEIIQNIVKIVNNDLASLFIREYSDEDEAIFHLEIEFDNLQKEINRFKAIKIELEKYSKYDENLKYFILVVDKLLSQIEMFFIRLENSILGDKEEVKLVLEADNEIELLNQKLNKKYSFNLKNFLLGLGLGYLIWSD